MFSAMASALNPVPSRGSWFTGGCSRTRAVIGISSKNGPPTSGQFASAVGVSRTTHTPLRPLALFSGPSARWNSDA